MTFTDTERRYLVSVALGRLATIGPTGAPHNHPVTYRVNEDTETIDIGGPHLSDSRKYRNIQANPRVSPHYNGDGLVDRATLGAGCGGAERDEELHDRRGVPERQWDIFPAGDGQLYLAVGAAAILSEYG